MSYDNELWDLVPGTAYMALGRRGQESLDTNQCFLPSCDNSDIEQLEPFEKSIDVSEKDKDGQYFECVKVKTKCKKCNGVFQYAMKNIYRKTKDEDGGDVEPFMSMLYILGENGENLGFVGYF
jgi:hypothetical protein